MWKGSNQDQCREPRNDAARERQTLLDRTENGCVVMKSSGGEGQTNGRQFDVLVEEEPKVQTYLIKAENVKLFRKFCLL